VRCTAAVVKSMSLTDERPLRQHRLYLAVEHAAISTPAEKSGGWRRTGQLIDPIGDLHMDEVAADRTDDDLGQRDRNHETD